jgi:hypothetical protein
MTNIVIASENFKKEAKSLIKKFHTLKESIDNIISDLIKDPYCGDPYEGITILLMSIFDKLDKATITKADAVKKLNNILKDL